MNDERMKLIDDILEMLSDEEKNYMLKKLDGNSLESLVSKLKSSDKEPEENLISNKEPKDDSIMINDKEEKDGLLVDKPYNQPNDWVTAELEEEGEGLLIAKKKEEDIPRAKEEEDGLLKAKEPLNATNNFCEQATYSEDLADSVRKYRDVSKQNYLNNVIPTLETANETTLNLDYIKSQGSFCKPLIFGKFLPDLVARSHDWYEDGKEFYNPIKFAKSIIRKWCLISKLQNVSKEIEYLYPIELISEAYRYLCNKKIQVFRYGPNSAPKFIKDIKLPIAVSQYNDYFKLEELDNRSSVCREEFIRDIICNVDNAFHKYHLDGDEYAEIFRSYILAVDHYNDMQQCIPSDKLNRPKLRDFGLPEYSEDAIAFLERGGDKRNLKRLDCSKFGIAKLLYKHYNYGFEEEAYYTLRKSLIKSCEDQSETENDILYGFYVRNGLYLTIKSVLSYKLNDHYSAPVRLIQDVKSYIVKRYDLNDSEFMHYVNPETLNINLENLNFESNNVREDIQVLTEIKDRILKGSEFNYARTYRGDKNLLRIEAINHHRIGYYY